VIISETADVSSATEVFVQRYALLKVESNRLTMTVDEKDSSFELKEDPSTGVVTLRRLASAMDLSAKFVFDRYKPEKSSLDMLPSVICPIGRHSLLKVGKWRIRFNLAPLAFLDFFDSLGSLVRSENVFNNGVSSFDKQALFVTTVYTGLLIKSADTGTLVMGKPIPKSGIIEHFRPLISISKFRLRPRYALERLDKCPPFFITVHQNGEYRGFIVPDENCSVVVGSHLIRFTSFTNVKPSDGIAIAVDALGTSFVNAGIRKEKGSKSWLMADKVSIPEMGIILEVSTTQPLVQI